MDFSIQINDFLNNGILVPQIDDGGNIYLNGSSSNFNQNYIPIPLQTSVYNTSSIETYYPIQFTEFISIPLTSSLSIQDLNTQISQLNAITSSLETQLNDIMTSQTTGSTSADLQANRQVIINLRIALGQGYVSSDFSNIFPYSPLSSSLSTTKMTQPTFTS